MHHGRCSYDRVRQNKKATANSKKYTPEVRKLPSPSPNRFICYFLEALCLLRSNAISPRYSALFVDEDPDIDLGKGAHTAGGRNGQGVSITGSGHVRLRQKNAAQGHGDGGAGQTSERVPGQWEPGSSDEDEGFQVGGTKPASPRKVHALLSVALKQVSQVQKAL